MGNKVPRPNIPRPNINIPRPTLPKFLQKDSGGAAAAGEAEGAAAADDNAPKIVENDATAAQVDKYSTLVTGERVALEFVLFGRLLPTHTYAVGPFTPGRDQFRETLRGLANLRIL